MNMKVAALVVGVGMLLAAVPVWAHHAFASEFDAKRPVKLRGTVTKMEWINPHAWMHMDVKKRTARWKSGWSKPGRRTRCCGGG